MVSNEQLLQLIEHLEKRILEQELKLSQLSKEVAYVKFRR